MRLNWGSRARRDLHELISYIAEDSVQAAELIATRVLATAELLSERPHVGRPGRVKGTRKLVILRTPYLLVYRIKSGNVRILRIFHGARKWPARFD